MAPCSRLVDFDYMTHIRLQNWQVYADVFLTNRKLCHESRDTVETVLRL